MRWSEHNVCVYGMCQLGFKQQLTTPILGLVLENLSDEASLLRRRSVVARCIMFWDGFWVQFKETIFVFIIYNSNLNKHQYTVKTRLTTHEKCTIMNHQTANMSLSVTQELEKVSQFVKQSTNVFTLSMLNFVNDVIKNCSTWSGVPRRSSLIRICWIRGLESASSTRFAPSPLRRLTFGDS